MNIEALIISTDEPQLERCLESVKNQTIPFSNIVHINGVVPESVAFNRGMSLITEEWVMHIAGDFILYENAVAVAIENMEKYHDDKIFTYTYQVYDAFLKCDLCGCSVSRASAYKSVPFRDVLSDDIWAGRRLLRQGLIRKDLQGIVIGTHFDSPDEFQVFRRFYARGIKRDWRNFGRILNALANGNPMYELALKALEFGNLKKHYPTSHNIDFDRKMFEEFNGRKV